MAGSDDNALATGRQHPRRKRQQSEPTGLGASAAGRGPAARVVRGYRGFHYSYPRWGLRPWFAMTLGVWVALLLRHRFAISPARLPTALLTTVLSGVSSLLGLIQSLLFASRIRQTELAGDPVFIIGHWRSGTTFLHELLALDERFVWPTAVECFAPAHFLVSQWLAPLVGRLAPDRRPMDWLRFGLDRPQEDEWAIALLGLGSPYETIAFPDHRPVRPDFLSLDGVSPRALQHWERGLYRFLQAVQLRAERGSKHRRAGAGRPRCLLLKSPTHTARLRVLCDMFPQARFIHVVRNPAELFASTVRLWTVLYDIYGFHKPHRGAPPGGGPSIEEYVLQTLPLLYRGFDEAKAAISPQRWHEVRFEELVQDPAGQVERIYRQFGLGPFAAMRAKIGEFVDGFGSERSEYPLPPELLAKIAARWAEYAQRYGYVRSA